MKDKQQYLKEKERFLEDREQELLKQKNIIEDRKSNLQQTFNHFYDTLDHIPKDPKSHRNARHSPSPSQETKTNNAVHNKNNSTLDHTINNSKDTKPKGCTSRNGSPSSITQKMSRAYDNLVIPQDSNNHLKPIAVQKHRIMETKELQRNRIDKALKKDIDIECTFKPEINQTSRDMLNKNSHETKILDKDYDFIKEFIEQNRSLLNSYKDAMGPN